MKRYFLVDCNNFYVSCERVFNPMLNNRSVVVLGSNDACVIARSNEAKALGIAMGAPTFECERLFKQHHVIVYSANFALYGDMSNRVMQTLTEYATDIEIYSVDEAFLSVADQRSLLNSCISESKYYHAYAHCIRAAVKKNTGIPVSIGIGSTKTLAKIANKIAKKNPQYGGVFDVTDIDCDPLLKSFDVEDIWGIGSRYAVLLKRNNINTAYDLKCADQVWIRKNLSIVALKTVLELNGTSCLPLNEVSKSKQSITVSRSFGKKTSDIEHLKQALASYVSCAAVKLRAQKSLTARIMVYAVTNKYHDPINHYVSTQCQLLTATDYTPHLIKAVHDCLHKIFKSHCIYKKVGVVLDDLVDRDYMQTNLFNQTVRTEKQGAYMKAVDHINAKWGRNTLFFAASGIEKPWKMHQAHKSACFTTNWHELLTITI